MEFFEALGSILGFEGMYVSLFQLGVVFAFAASGEWVAERAGTLNISVEAMMLAGAFGAAFGMYLINSSIVGVLAGCAAGMLVASAQANLSHRLAANQFVVGLALNVLVLGLTAYLVSVLDLGRSRAMTWRIPLLVDIPLVGSALFGRPWPAYLVYVAMPGLAWLVYRTRWGLNVRAVGENPQAADVSGIDVNAHRRQAILVCGVMAGFAGAFLLVGQVGTFTGNIVSGRGFIALAAVIFGGWTLRGTIIGCALFAFVEALAISIPVKGYKIDSFILDSAPYVVALAVMLFFAGRVRQPAALAQPFVRGLT